MTNRQFATKATTSIYHAVADLSNDYIPTQVSLAGYDLLELMQGKTFVDVVYLLLSGELPSAETQILLNKLMISFIDLGPQHPAIRAAMVAGVSKSNTENLLPIGLMVLGGAEGGAKEVEQAYQFIEQHLSQCPTTLAQTYREKIKQANYEVTQKENRVMMSSIAPGFGSLFGGIDVMSEKIATLLVAESAQELPALNWVLQFSGALRLQGMGCLPPAIVAAAGIDIKLDPRATLALFQLMCGPGIVAHGIEQTHKPVTAMPFLDDCDYDYLEAKKSEK